MKSAIVGIAAAVLLLGAGVGRADVIFSVSSNKPLGSFSVGQTATISVNVQLTNHEDLDGLTAKIVFTTGFFTLTTPVASPLGSGGIVPDPADDFIGTTHVNTSPPGFDDADGSFFLPIGGDITTSGTFFQFNATLKKAGAFTFGFDKPSTLATANGIPLNNLVIPPLQVIGGTTSSVPEPASLLLWGAAGCVVVVLRRRTWQQPRNTFDG